MYIASGADTVNLMQYMHNESTKVQNAQRMHTLCIVYSISAFYVDDRLSTLA